MNVCSVTVTQIVSFLIGIDSFLSLVRCDVLYSVVLSSSILTFSDLFQVVRTINSLLSPHVFYVFLSITPTPVDNKYSSER
jgi:hypothetical protein